MDLTSLIYFQELAKELNFTKAAENMHITQQCLSQNIKRLEEKYGVLFFERKPHIRLSTAGKAFLKTAQIILNAEEELRAELSYISENQCGNIILGIPAGRAHGFLSIIMPTFSDIYPNVAVVLKEANSETLEALLAKGEIDIMIGSRLEDHESDNPLFRCLSLLQETLYLLVSDSLLFRYFSDNFTEHKARMSKGVRMRELMELPLVMDPDQSRIQKKVEQLFIYENCKPNYYIRSNHGSSLLTLCQQGYCALFILQMILHNTVDLHPDLREKVNIFPLTDPFLKNEVILLYRKDRTLPKYLNHFIKLTVKIFASYFSAEI